MGKLYGDVEMITKVGNELTKQAMPSPEMLAVIGGAALGSQRAYNLSEDQKDALRAQDGINSGSFGLNLRNSTRGALGALTGGGVGAIMGGIASGIADVSRGGQGMANPRVALATGVLGAALGGWKATNKYSKGNADAILACMDKIRNRQEERRQLSEPEIRLSRSDLESLLGRPVRE